MEKRVTINDVARRCRVTPSTVSRVLNQYTKNFSVAPNVRRRILRAVEELGYRGDPLARAMRSRQTLMIGVHVPHIDVSTAASVEAVQYLCVKRGYEILLAVHRRPEEVDAAFQRHLDRKVDGLLLVSPAFTCGRTVC